MTPGLRRLAAAALAVLALDRLAKIWVVVWLDLGNRLEIEVWPPFLTLRMLWNRGINFGLFAGSGEWGRFVLIALGVAIPAALVWWFRRADGWLQPLAVGLIAGGALGNALDRVLWGAVADFLNMSCCGIDNPFSFNIADVAIFLGVALLLLRSQPAPPRSAKSSRDDGGGLG
jgi:signal peptidase II